MESSEPQTSSSAPTPTTSSPTPTISSSPTSIGGQKIRSLRYSPAFIRSKLTCQAVPIPGQLPIPNITMIDICKKNSVITDMRKLFNTVTGKNINEIKETLHKTVTEYIVKLPKEKIEEGMNEIANEMLHNFIVSESNIDIYMQMLNKISNVVVILEHSDPKTGKPILSRPIKYYFLNNCKTLIFKYISEEHIRELSMKDQENEDELDFFNKEKAKICNLIITICHLYDQRNSNDIQLSAIPIYGIMSLILSKHASLITNMKQLGNPYEDEECTNELEYDYLNKMASMYAEQLIIFLDFEYESFMKDTTVIQEKTPSGTGPERKLKDLIEKFGKDVQPHVSEPHLKMKCEKFIA
jgi:hypothetical protein